MKTNKVLALVLVVLLTFSLVSCGEKQADVIDYGDAESFEAALNAGENLEGKIVQFVAHDFVLSGANYFQSENSISKAKVNIAQRRKNWYTYFGYLYFLTIIREEMNYG